MTEVRLTDNQWTKIREFLLQDPNAYVGKDEEAGRSLVEAVKWVSHSGDYCLLTMATGTRFTKGLFVGAKQVSGNGRWNTLQMTPIWKTG